MYFLFPQKTIIPNSIRISLKQGDAKILVIFTIAFEDHFRILGSLEITSEDDTCGIQNVVVRISNCVAS